MGKENEYDDAVLDALVSCIGDNMDEIKRMVQRRTELPVDGNRVLKLEGECYFTDIKGVNEEFAEAVLGHFKFGWIR